ncbi:MAG TPA: ATP-binding protein [Opitutaceae bacterium]|nr:ATP-binding protein [Opitutaceae bacterium]
MKVSFPLSLKISLWLLLNLLLLGAVGVGFLLAHGGLGWGALMSGPAGDRVQSIGDILVGEINAATPAGRDAVLARFSQAYGAEFSLFYNRGTQIAGVPVKLPEAVRAQLVPPAREGPMRDAAFAAPPDMPPRADELPPARGGAPGMQPPPADGERPPGMQRPPPDGERPPRSEPPVRAEGRARGRFLIHDNGYWIGLRVPFRASEDELPAPATLFVHVASPWGLARMLDVLPWLLAGAAVLVVSVLFWLPLVRGITHALGQLTAATGQIAEGRFDTRVPAARRDELGRLGESVNSMAARLETLVDGQKRFLGDVAHELGSPLARLQVAIEILETRSDPALHEQIGDVREEVQQMTALVNELLAFTKAGMRPREAVRTVVILDELVADVLMREDTTARVQRAVDPGLTVLADPALLGRATGNLVRNALRYAGDASPIHLSARRDGAHVLVVVEDEGPGVPADALARLGEPFYRPEIARTRETGGVGLGLAIVRSSVAACGGEVHFTNRSPRGFRAEIRLAAA